MPQFTLKRLFVSVTIVAVGCSILAWLRGIGPGGQTQNDLIFAIPLICGFSLIGAGIGNILR
jgi:hypothetical protein